MSKITSFHIPVMLFFLVAVQLIALAVTPAISASGSRVFEDPAEISNPIVYMLLILIFTGILLLAIKLKGGWLVSAAISFSIAATIFYVMDAILPAWLALLPTVAIMLLLRFYPEWYIVDIFGILVCAGISSLLGVSMAIPPALLLLVILAIYDAISVYKTRHMVSLAEGAIKMRAPLLFVVPKSRDYSFRRGEDISLSKDEAVSEDESLFKGKAVSKNESVPRDKAGEADGKADEKKDRGAYFLGLGDAIIPTILVISASWSYPAWGALGLNAPAIGAMLGTYAGFLLLMTTSRDRPQAGLPFLNSGAILGFLAGCFAAGVWPF